MMEEYIVFLNEEDDHYELSTRNNSVISSKDKKEWDDIVNLFEVN